MKVCVVLIWLLELFHNIYTFFIVYVRFYEKIRYMVYWDR